MLQRAQALGWRPPAAAMPDNVIPLSRFRDTTRRDADDVLQQLLCDTRLAIGRTLARRGAPTMPPIRPWRGHRLWFAAMFVFTAVLVASLAGVA
ncbi:MAG: hypothetical protein K1X88_19035 [Nannocystaceae bacterium]|nr:hypothetical protein [Nannocystaceae bacterium]